MLYRRSVAVASAFAAATWFTAAAASGATVRPVVPWTDQTVYALSPTDSYVAEWMGLSTGWIEIGGPATKIYAGSAGVFELDASGNIWMYNGTPFSWTEIGGPGDEFAEGGGHLYGLGPNDDYVAEWNGTPNSWTIIGGAAGWITAGTDGLLAGAPYGTTEDVWHYNGTPNNWTDISGPGYGFVVGQNAVFRVNEDRDTVSEWTGGTTWTTILTVGINDLLDPVGGDAGLYISYETSDAGPVQYLEYDGSPNNWSVIGGGPGAVPTPIVESRTSLFGVTDGSNGRVANVDVYSGSGTAWTVIGGPADPSLAAGD
jgi:hypothetical protein